MGFQHVDIPAMVTVIDSELERQRRSFFTPIEANEILHKAGVLINNPKEPGKNLRIVLNSGRIQHAYKLAGPTSHWVIPHSNARRTLDKPTTD